MKTSEILLNNGISPSKWFGECMKIYEETESIEEVRKFIIEKTIEENSKIITLENSDDKFEYNLKEEDICENSINVLKSFGSVPHVKNIKVFADLSFTGDYSTPVGSTIISSKIHPNFHSADLHCSVTATEIPNDLNNEVLELNIQERTHFGTVGNRHSRKKYNYSWRQHEDQIPEILYNRDNPFAVSKKQLIKEFGTLGDGNHFALLGNNDDKRYVVTHFGSRGCGASIFKEAVRLSKLHCKGKNLPNGSEILPEELNEIYIKTLKALREWVYNNHFLTQNLICENMLNKNNFMKCTHNTLEQISSDEYAHLKGSTLFKKNEKALIPLNYKRGILIVSSKQDNFGPHGAGRNKSRKQFLKTFEGDFEDLINVKFINWLGEKDYSEHWSAYKNPQNVEDSLSDLNIKIENVIKPYFVVMAGKIKKRKNNEL